MVDNNPKIKKVERRIIEVINDNILLNLQLITDLEEKGWIVDKINSVITQSYKSGNDYNSFNDYVITHYYLMSHEYIKKEPEVQT